AGLSRAALQYSEQHWNADFVKNARDSEARSFQQMVRTFMIWHDQIKHPQPELAIRFAFVIVALTLRELLLFNRAHLFEAILPINDELLASELTRMFLQYLGAGLAPGLSAYRPGSCAAGQSVRYPLPAQTV